jgi:DegV family protein with EDD domain
MGFEIVTDSPCNLPDEMIDRYGLHILSLEFNIEGTVYRGYVKGEVTDLRAFYTMMREGKKVTTSLPSMQDVEAMAREIFGRGNDILYLGFDSALSGTFERVSAQIGKIRESEFPERACYSVDTLAAALGQGLLVVDVCEKRDAGMGLEELATWAQEHRLEYAHWFTVEDLKYLQRGGRLSKGAALAGTLLSIKPVLHVDDVGRLVPVEKVRGRKKSVAALFDRFATTAVEPKAEQRVYISHGDCLEDAEALADMIREQFGVSDVVINVLDPVIGAHAGPGTLALFFVTDQER